MINWEDQFADEFGVPIYFVDSLCVQPLSAGIHLQITVSLKLGPKHQRGTIHSIFLTSDLYVICRVVWGVVWFARIGIETQNVCLP